MEIEGENDVYMETGGVDMNNMTTDVGGNVGEMDSEDVEMGGDGIDNVIETGEKKDESKVNVATTTEDEVSIAEQLLKVTEEATVAEKLIEVRQTPTQKPKSKSLVILGTEKEEVIIPQDTRINRKPTESIMIEVGVLKIMELDPMDCKFKGKEILVEKEVQAVNPRQAQIDEDAGIARKILEDEISVILKEGQDGELAKKTFEDE